jgi:electron transfer flavoprotein beta subunit
MNTVVLIKPIRDEQATDGWAIGSLDVYSLSHALHLRDQTGGEVRVLVVGPASAANVVQRSLASGADAAIHLQVDRNDQLDALAMSSLIAESLGHRPFDLLLVGQTSDDVETGLVGPMVAEILGLPHVSTVTRIEPREGGLRLERDVVGGYEVIDVSTPVVLVVLSGRTIPLRYPTPRGMIAARKKSVQVEEPAAAGLVEGITWSEPRAPERGGDGEILSGLPPQEAAARIASWLRERGLAG